MTPWLLTASLLACIGSFFYGQHVGEQAAEVQTARDERIAAKAIEAGQQGAAAAIAKLKPKNVTIRQELEREIQTNTVYSDCRVPAGGVRLINEAITGRPQLAGGGELPRAGPVEAGP